MTITVTTDERDLIPHLAALDNQVGATTARTATKVTPIRALTRHVLDHRVHDAKSFAFQHGYLATLAAQASLQADELRRQADDLDAHATRLAEAATTYGRLVEYPEATQ